MLEACALYNLFKPNMGPEAVVIARGQVRTARCLAIGKT
jgi:hypothetical protein